MLEERDFKLRVLYILHDASVAGGSSFSFLDMMDVLHEDIIPYVILPYEGGLEEKLVSRGIEYSIIRYSSQVIAQEELSEEVEYAQLSNNILAAVKISEIVTQKNIDIIHTNSGVCDVGAIVAAITGKPHMWHIREIVRDHFKTDYLNLGLKKKLFAKADRLIAISKYVKERCREIYDLDMTLIYNTISKKCIDNNKRTSHNRNFLLSGNIYKAKGQWDAIKASKCLVENGNKDFCVFLVGYCPERTLWAIQRFIRTNNMESNVKLYPYMQDLSIIRNKCSFALNCSRMEAFGRTTIEGMLAGKVVIGNDTGATAELIGNDERRGFLYRSGDYTDLADKMIKAVNMGEKEYYDMVDAATEYAEGITDGPSFRSQMLKIYYEILSSGNTANDSYSKVIMDACETAISRLSEKNIVNDLMLGYIQLNGNNVSSFFDEKQIKNIAIYGMGRNGMQLSELLSETDVTVSFFVDKNPDDVENVIPIADDSDSLNSVDALIVTVSSEENDLVEHYRQSGVRAYGISEVYKRSFELTMEKSKI